MYVLCVYFDMFWGGNKDFFYLLLNLVFFFCFFFSFFLFFSLGLIKEKMKLKEKKCLSLFFPRVIQMSLQL